MIETTSRDCFNHAQNNHVSTMIRAMHCLMSTLFVTKHVLFVIRLIMFRPGVNTALGDRDTFEKQRDAYINASSELQRTKERLRELQVCIA